MSPAIEAAEVRHETGGYGVYVPSGMAAGTRIALVHDFDGASLGELTVHGGVGWRYFAVRAELTGIAGTSEIWSDASLGNVMVDARLLLGDHVTHAIGLRGRFPMDPGSDVAWWGTVPTATVPLYSVSFAWEMAAERYVVHARTGLKFGSTAGLFGGNFGDILDVGLGVAWIQPIQGPFSFVGEVEVLATESPAHIRALGRLEPGAGFNVDLGLAVPLVEVIADPTLQVVLAAQKRW